MKIETKISIKITIQADNKNRTCRLTAKLGNGNNKIRTQIINNLRIQTDTKFRTQTNNIITGGYNLTILQQNYIRTQANDIIRI